MASAGASISSSGRRFGNLRHSRLGSLRYGCGAGTRVVHGRSEFLGEPRGMVDRFEEGAEELLEGGRIGFEFAAFQGEEIA